MNIMQYLHIDFNHLHNEDSFDGVLKISKRSLWRRKFNILIVDVLVNKTSKRIQKNTMSRKPNTETAIFVY